MAAYRRVYDSRRCRLTAKNRDQLRNPTLRNRVWTTFAFKQQRQTRRIVAVYPACMTCDKTRVCLIMGRHGRGRPTRRKHCRYSGVTVGRIITQKKDDQWASTVCIPQHVYIPPAARCMFTRRFKNCTLLTLDDSMGRRRWGFGCVCLPVYYYA